jgi:hypothetical protein
MEMADIEEEQTGADKSRQQTSKESRQKQT